VKGVVYGLYDTPRRHDKGISGEHVYMPRFNLAAPHKRDYLRGFGMQFWNTGSYQDGAPVASYIPGFGASFKREVKRRAPAGSSCIPSARSSPTPTTGSPSTPRAPTATACP
jgi:hypothetical protein